MALPGLLGWRRFSRTSDFGFFDGTSHDKVLLVVFWETSSASPKTTVLYGV